VQHTGFDIEQVQQLYNYCEELLVKYRLRGNQINKNNADLSPLSPINMLAVEGG
jgi:hypothetical protein